MERVETPSFANSRANENFPVNINRAKERIREITREPGVSLVRVIVELNLFLIEWLTCYRYAACRFELELQCLDEWTRRKLRCYRLKQCKRGKSIAGFLKKLGASPSLAHRVASSGKGWWRLSLTRASHQAVSADWLHSRT